MCVPCLATDGCRLIVPISRNEMRRRMLPIPDLRPETSSLTMRCGLALGFGFSLTTAPALRVKSFTKVSRSLANFRSALSKSASLNVLRPDPLTCGPLIVALLRLLPPPPRWLETMEKRRSSESLERRL